MVAVVGDEGRTGDVEVKYYAEHAAADRAPLCMHTRHRMRLQRGRDKLIIWISTSHRF